jgi:hypothetical protein
LGRLQFILFLPSCQDFKEKNCVESKFPPRQMPGAAKSFAIHPEKFPRATGFGGNQGLL